MADEPLQPAGTPPATPPAEPPKTYADYIGEGGVLKEGWINHFVPQDMREKPIYGTIKDLKGVFSKVGHQAELVGRKGVLMPTDASGQSEWDAYFEAKGRPATKEDYTLIVPEELKDNFDEELIGEARQLFHQAGFNQKEVDMLWQFEVARQTKLNQLLAQMEEQDYQQADAALHDKWKGAYNENKLLANRTITENTAEGEERQYLLDLVGNDPRFAEFCFRTGARLKQHGVITDIETPSAEADSKIKELMGTNLPPAERVKLPYWNTSHPDHKATVKIVSTYFQQQAERRKTGTLV